MKYILFLILLINTSFINTTQKYWVGYALIKDKDNKNSNWSDASVIEGTDSITAIGKFKKYLIKRYGTATPVNDIIKGDGNFYIYELTKKNIIK